METDKARGPDYPPDVLERFAKRVRARREEINLSQGELATLAGVSRGTIKTAERGDVKLAAKSIVGINRALGWAPSPLPHFVSGGFSPRAVLSADAVRAIADTILPITNDQGFMRARLEFHNLIDGLADDPPMLPESFSFLHEVMAETIPVRVLVNFDRELRQRLGDNYPFRPALGGQGLGALIPSRPALDEGSVETVIAGLAQRIDQAGRALAAATAEAQAVAERLYRAESARAHAQAALTELHAQYDAMVHHQAISSRAVDYSKIAEDLRYTDTDAD